MRFSPFLVRTCVFGLALGAAAPLTAQTMQPSGAVAPSGDPAQSLSDSLRALARDPYNVDALLQAGTGALAVGDPNAAFGFFARAEELSPSNAKAKAGLGSSLTMMEKSREALRAFDEAVALGLPESGILADRGLAHDLSGDARRAQKDYLAALKSSSSDEVTRRLALSLGISGDKDAALARLDPLVRRNDQAAWRARAFILAMNGDSAGAEKIVRMVAPAGTTQSMLSFMQRLADLGPGARAHAVHFGTLPASGTAIAAVQDPDGFRPVDPTAAARLSAPPPERTAVVTTTPISAKDARRKAREDAKLAKLAAKGREASQGDSRAPLPVRTPPEVAARVAAVLPSQADKPVIVRGATSLPLPDAVAARQAPAGQPVVVGSRSSDATLVASAANTPPAPLFEVPASAPVPKVAAPATSTPQRVLPQTQAQPSAADRLAAMVPQSAPSVPPSGPQIPLASKSPETTSQPTAVKPVDLPPAQVAQQQLASVPMSAAATPPAASAPTSVPTATAPSPTEVVAAAPSPAAPVQAAAPAPALTLSEIVKTLELEQESAAAPLPNEAQIRAARLAAQKKAAADAKAKAEQLAEEKRIAEEEANARRNPARIWVQIATGNNRSGLPGTWRKLKDQASKSLARQSAWTVPFRQTNRLLVGPLKSTADARELVSSLAKEGVQATTFSSEAGQEISRIGGK